MKTFLRRLTRGCAYVLSKKLPPTAAAKIMTTRITHRSDEPIIVVMANDSRVDGLSVTQDSSERFIKGVFVILGVGVLLPWNAFVSAKPYFQARLCAEASGISANIELWFGFIYNLSSVLSLASIILLQWWNDGETVMSNGIAGNVRCSGDTNN